jgi:hypothetical protein
LEAFNEGFASTRTGEIEDDLKLDKWLNLDRVFRPFPLVFRPTQEGTKADSGGDGALEIVDRYRGQARTELAAEVQRRPEAARIELHKVATATAAVSPKPETEPKGGNEAGGGDGAPRAHEEWSIPMPLADLANRLDNMEYRKAKAFLMQYKLRGAGNRQSWQIRLDLMPPNLRQKIEQKQQKSRRQ